MFFKGRNIALVWWGNSALTEALYLADICKSVKLIHRKNIFRAEEIWVQQVHKKENIELVLNEEVKEIKWSLFVEEVELKSGKTLAVDGIFIAIGSNPSTHIVDNLAPQKDEEWCLVVDKRQETSITWLYAAWDVSTNSNKFKQAIMSAAEGCLSANSVHEDILHRG
jgi:thioredoxin reductase (NADPH)